MSVHARSWMLRWLIVLTLAVATFATLAPKALAHPGRTASDGCHYCRTNCDSWGVPWNERHCHGGSSSGSTSDSGGSSAPPPSDTNPPSSPDVEDTTVDGNTVAVTVSAERGSTLRVVTAATTVATATATGSDQELSFTLADGTHRLEITARDAAGNVSTGATATVVVDGTAPTPAVLGLASPAEASSPWTGILVTGEPGADWELTGTGLDAQTGSLPTGGQAEVLLLIPNGAHETVVLLTDDAGNVSAPATLSLEVAIPAPDAPGLEIAGPAGSGTPDVEVTGPPAGSATVEVQDSDGRKVAAEEMQLDDDGEGTASFELDDGEYEVVVVAADFQGQASSETRTELTVDTVGPDVEVVVDEALLGQGRISWSVRTEDGAGVRLASPDLGLDERFDADGQERTGELETDRSGAFDLEVVATDAFGNETVRTLEFTVSQPASTASTVTGFGILALLAYGAYRGVRWAVGKVRTASAGR